MHESSDAAVQSGDESAGLREMNQLGYARTHTSRAKLVDLRQLAACKDTRDSGIESAKQLFEYPSIR